MALRILVAKSPTRCPFCPAPQTFHSYTDVLVLWSLALDISKVQKVKYVIPSLSCNDRGESEISFVIEGSSALVMSNPADSPLISISPAELIHGLRSRLHPSLIPLGSCPQSTAPHERRLRFQPASPFFKLVVGGRLLAPITGTSKPALHLVLDAAEQEVLVSACDMFRRAYINVLMDQGGPPS